MNDEQYEEIDSWTVLSNRPDAIAAPSAPAPTLLPFDEQTWETFEQSMLLVAERVDGLHDARIYGIRGQRQHGIDVYGTDDIDRQVGYQAKRYTTFTAADLKEAVEKFATGTRPVAAEKFVVCVSRALDETAFAETLVELRTRYDFEIELYDARRLSAMLKARPDLVRRLFGQAWAEAFCDETGWDAPELSADQALADAVLRGPVRVFGLESKLARVDPLAATDPSAAADLLADVVLELTNHGFGGLTDGLKLRQSELLIEAGDVATAGAILARLAFEQLESGHAYWNREPLGRLRALASEHPAPRDVAFVAVMTDIEDWFGQPQQALVDLVDHVEVLRDSQHLLANEVTVWVAETALSIDDPVAGRLVPALEKAATDLVQTSGASELAVRAACCLADIHGDWTELVRLARRGELGPRLATLVHKRAGRFHTWNGDPQNAEDALREAVAQALAAQLPGEAAAALHSLIRVKTAYGPLSDDPNELQRLAQSVAATGSATFLGRGRDPHDAGVAALAADKLPEALRWMRIALRESFICGDLFGELSANRDLGEILLRSGEHGAAIGYLIRAGASKDAIRCVGGDAFVDLRAFLDVPAHWVRAVAMSALAAEADVIPDNLVDSIALVALDAAIEEPRSLFGPHVWLSAWSLVHALAHRLSLEQAARALDQLEAHIEREPNQYRHNDEDHVGTVVAIAASHPELAERTSRHLARVFDQRGHFAEQARVAVCRNLDHLPDALVERLTQLATEGDHTAQLTLLAYDTAHPALLEAARTRVAAEMARQDPTPGQFSFGTSLPRAGSLARILDPTEQADFAAFCITFAEDDRWPESNRSEAVQAMRPIARELAEPQRHDICHRCLQLTITPGANALDAEMMGSLHPLSTARIDLDYGSLPREALQTAALLANTGDDAKLVARRAVQMLLQDERDVYAAAHALNALEFDDVDVDPHLLAMHRVTWARQAAAACFSRRPDLAPELGPALARDPDARVRRALAGGLALLRQRDPELAARLADALRHDARWSIRRLVEAAENDDAQTDG